MELTIQKEKRAITISNGDIFVDNFTNESYLLCFVDFDNKNNSLYQLVNLNGSGKNFYNEIVLKETIIEDLVTRKFVQYSSDEFKLELSPSE